MNSSKNAEAKARRERLELYYSALNIYGSVERDKLFLETPGCKRRFAALGRKVLSHYAGDKYNPHTVDFVTEHFMRCHIEGIISSKVFFKMETYDWEYLDNFFKKVVSELLDIDIPYDMALFESAPKFTFKDNKVPSLEFSDTKH